MPGAPLPPAGMLLVDKPAGWTSYDAVAFTRGLVGAKRVGHTGTLDPLATGLLVVLYGTATKLADEAHRAPKAYLARVALGHETTTDDSEGEPTESAPVPSLDAASLRATLVSFVGARDQIPPAFSAVHVRGERAYQRARRGERVALGPRRVELFDLRLITLEPPAFDVLVTCSSGTYIRAVARDLGRALMTRGHLSALRRVASGRLFVEEAQTPDALRAAAATGTLGDHIRAGDVLREGISGVELAAEAARRLLSGSLAGTNGAGEGA